MLCRSDQSLKSRVKSKIFLLFSTTPLSLSESETNGSSLLWITLLLLSLLLILLPESLSSTTESHISKFTRLLLIAGMFFARVRFSLTRFAIIRLMFLGDFPSRSMIMMQFPRERRRCTYFLKNETNSLLQFELYHRWEYGRWDFWDRERTQL